MTILFSANHLVRDAYKQLEDVLRPGHLPPQDTLNQDVLNYVLDTLRSLAPDVAESLPRDGIELELHPEQAIYLLARFRDAVSIDVDNNKPSLSAGDVSFQFSCLIYYLLGAHTETLRPWQKALLLDVCEIAETRPLPVKRWTEFVRVNMYDAARIRTVMRSCIYSKTLLRSRLSGAVTAVCRDLHLSAPTSILAIGSSGTVRDALIGINELTKIEVYSTCPTPGVPFNRDNLGFAVNDITASKLLEGAHPKFDLVVMGCSVIGRTKAHEIEIVNWAHAVNVAKKIRSKTVPLLIIGGLYKIWPQHFYEANKDFVLDLREQSGSFHGILTEEDIDWLITEYQPVRLPRIPPWIKFLFNARSVDVTTSFSLCDDDAFIQNIVPSEEVYKIDRKLGSLKSLLNFERAALGELGRTPGLDDALAESGATLGESSTFSEKTSVDWDELDRISKLEEERMLDELALFYERAGIKKEESK